MKAVKDDTFKHLIALAKLAKFQWLFTRRISSYATGFKPITPGGGALCARRLLNAIFLQVSVKDHGLKLSDF